MSLTGFDNYSSVRPSLKLLIGSLRVHCRKMLKGRSQVLHLVPRVSEKWKYDKRSFFFPDVSPRSMAMEKKPKCCHPSWFQCSRTCGSANQSCRNVLLMRDPEGLLMLLPLLPLPPCRRSTSASPSASDKLRTVNFPVTSTAFCPVRIFSLRGSGPIIHRTIIDVGINYITAIRQGWLMSVAQTKDFN